MKVVYVAGAYRSKLGEYYVLENILTAHEAARHLWEWGYAVVCPHTNTFLMGGTDIDDGVFLDGNLEIMGRCDIVVMLPGWEQSTGARAEYRCAERMGKTIHRWTDDGWYGRMESTCDGEREGK